MKLLKTAAISAVMLGAASMGHAATVDFGGFTAPAELGMGADLGGGIIADVTATGGINKAIVFNTNVPTGGDGDLESPFVDALTGDPRSFGNALIVQENAGMPIIPDDVVGGTLTFDFASLVSINEVFLLDSAEGTAVTLLLNGSVVSSIPVTAANDSDTGNSNTVANPNKFSLLDFGGLQGDSLVISFVESGALGEFEASLVPAVPLPAGLPLLVGGLGAFAWMKRRKA